DHQPLPGRPALGTPDGAPRRPGGSLGRPRRRPGDVRSAQEGDQAMTPATDPATDERIERQRIEEGLQMVTAAFPHFAGLARVVRVELDHRIRTMGVFASGRLLVNPEFASALKPNELVFVLAHELFHLALRTHDRAIGSDSLAFNYAHDYIIN